MIILAGMIGVGKTTFTEKLAEALGTEAFFEPVDTNPILDKYYEDPDKYGFALQIYFLNRRFKSIKRAYAANNNVLDRSIYEDALFTYINTLKGSISQEEYDIYLDLLDNMMEEIASLPKKAPDLLVYLDGSFEHILENIQKRGRSYEQPTDENGLKDYYQLLHSHYADWYEAYDQSPKIRIETDGLDIHKENDWKRVFSYIRNEMRALGLDD
ncbi:deoxynucleoside kinase [Streptococcus massiliensis]|uniref:Deoxynucleoside kinase n=1 Tax=Streptococcus massiliensis TaxID=313439 RepID=A0A380KZU0_9STRE|nr:deoxynucleoside kinase [Streptococcus massiliensis]SUN76819.1 deoxynucleoside kinase [Streptococcus massiliensis]